MSPDWETKRYTLEDIEENDSEFNEKSRKINWIRFLLSKCNWEVIESLVTNEGHQLLTRHQIEEIQDVIEEIKPNQINVALDKIQNIVFNLISYLYSNLGIEEI